METITETNPKLEEFLVNKQVTSIFLHLKTTKKPLGVRQIQKELNLSSVGSTHWHLKKLLEYGAIKKITGNKYQIAEKYEDLRHIPMKVVINHYFIGNKLVPNVFLMIFFLINVLILLTFTFFHNLWILGFFIGLFSSIINLIVIIRFYKQITNSND